MVSLFSKEIIAFKHGKAKQYMDNLGGKQHET